LEAVTAEVVVPKDLVVGAAEMVEAAEEAGAETAVVVVEVGRRNKPQLHNLKNQQNQPRKPNGMMTGKLELLLLSQMLGLLRVLGVLGRL
jgi:hypothetical protein